MKTPKKTLEKFFERWKKNDEYGFNSFIRNNVPETIGDLSQTHGRKIVDKLLTNIVLENPDIFESQITDMLDEDEMRIAKLRPEGATKYIGIEIECFGPLTALEAQMLAIEHKIEEWVHVGYDGSIEPNSAKDNAFEFRILVKENNLKKSLAKVGKFLKAGKFKANETCGLHIHLDMRHRDMEKCYTMLRKFQNLMFAMVSEDRQTNDEYCSFVTDDNWNERMVAINRQAYNEHHTLEIRLHQGSTDVVEIGNWIKLLLKIVGTKAYPKSLQLNKKSSVVNWLGKDKTLKSYVRKNFDSSWDYREEDSYLFGDDEGESSDVV